MDSCCNNVSSTDNLLCRPAVLQAPIHQRVYSLMCWINERHKRSAREMLWKLSRYEHARLCVGIGRACQRASREQDRPACSLVYGGLYGPPINLLFQRPLSCRRLKLIGNQQVKLLKQLCAAFRKLFIMYAKYVIPLSQPTKRKFTSQGLRNVIDDYASWFNRPTIKLANGFERVCTVVHKNGNDYNQWDGTYIVRAHTSVRINASFKCKIGTFKNDVSDEARIEENFEYLPIAFTG